MGRTATLHRMEKKGISYQCSESKGVGVNTDWGGLWALLKAGQTS